MGKVDFEGMLANMKADDAAPLFGKSQRMSDDASAENSGSSEPRPAAAKAIVRDELSDLYAFSSDEEEEGEEDAQ